MRRYFVEAMEVNPLHKEAKNLNGNGSFILLLCVLVSPCNMASIYRNRLIFRFPKTVPIWEDICGTRIWWKRDRKKTSGRTEADPWWTFYLHQRKRVRMFCRISIFSVFMVAVDHTFVLLVFSAGHHPHITLLSVFSIFQYRHRMHQNRRWEKQSHMRWTRKSI